MIRIETMIAVKDVERSSHYYQTLFGVKSMHGGKTFEILEDDGQVVLCLHKWGEHDHPTMMDPNETNGNGLILFFRVSDLQDIYDRAIVLDAAIEKGIHYNENSLKNQFILRDLDGYYLIISE